MSDRQRLALFSPVLLVRGACCELVEDAHVRDASHMVAGDRNDVFGDAVIAYLGGLVEENPAAQCGGAGGAGPVSAEPR